MRLKITNLTNEITETDLINVFSEFGSIETLTLKIDAHSESICALVETDDDTGSNLLKYLQSDVVKGNTINIQLET